MMSSERPAAGVPPFWVLWIIGPCVLAALVWLLYPIVTGARVASDPQPESGSPAARNPAASPASSDDASAARARIFESACRNHIGFCASVILQDVSMNEGPLPGVADWPDVVCPGRSIDDFTLCPSRSGDPLPHYAFNAAVAGRRLDEIASPETTVMLYEASQPGTPVFPHRGGAYYAFVDAHVEWLHERDRPQGILTSVPATEASHTQAVAPPSDAARQACISNLKQLALSHLMYMQDNDERMPPKDDWSTCLFPYYKNEEILRCPADRADARLSYDMNPEVAGIDVADVERPAQTFLLYEVDESGHLVLRHDGGANYAFMDGHTKWLADPPEDSGLVAREE